jgi:Sin3 histone deacetylase corepressor complex component SDS3
MYRDKLASLKDQLIQLETGLHPEYLRKIRRLEQIYEDRIVLNESFLAFETDRIEREYINEKKSAVREFEERKIELKENLISELEDKKKMIETERISLELTNDSTEPKPLTTRKLRRRPNEPIPIPEKRRRVSPTQLNLLLDENEIIEDLKTLNRANNSKLSAGLKKVYSCQFDFEPMPTVFDARIEDGKLFYDKKWFHRGQNVLIETNELKFNAILVQIGSSEIWIKKTNDAMKSKITLTDLHNGKYALYRRSS